MDKYVIIVAGGSGSRMKADRPKQFLSLQGKPILMHTLEAFHHYDKHLHILLVLPAAHLETWQRLVEEHDFPVSHRVTTGGDTRFDSVRNGLQLIDTDGLVAIHDGARPLVCSEVIHRTYTHAQLHQNAVASVAIKDSLREIKSDHNQAVDRSAYVAIQTPQTFQVQTIRHAFATANPQQSFTDDASVLESIGGQINLVQGSYENIKITTPEDIILAEALLTHRKK
ncbi:2-C-methyl-D-erythritol 4-phosphate cytidylyltransferase [Reichenbachiella sp. 5M10]|uniref:2-C-methyl-D-erythritol 4-phosphate cytidylyltransferase n=1 Tax=Reichenbachiella sp. 5M10 TaxID=1889772 RepID=UPI000C154C36|nr:2-C-methyl-D-erythritol 4-phosphate cytidylyltransferase [Reichenbachiella sp. 5M10]PIB34473.1 2-C-methyl-D-erythritol 4-phosphate cytidylyltransferase [Reichenbachiella sp. 5M10]